MNENILLSVEMITYKHEAYIKQAIEGVLMQETNFEFELIIADDCSPDNTENVVRDFINKHPKGHLIKYFRHEKNIGMNANASFAVNQCHGKYVAICEGDDYWIDPLKLQKQVDFLEANQDYGLIHTQTFFKHFNSDEIQLSSTDRSNNNFEDLIYKNTIATLTTCFKKDLLMKYLQDVKPQDKPWVAGDLPLWLWFSLNSKIYFLNEVTTVYRVVPGSASNTIGSAKYFEFVKSRLSIKEHFIREYRNDQKLLDYIYDDFYKDVEYHSLKLRNLESMEELMKNFKEKNNVVKYYYFSILKRTVNYTSLFEFIFLFYKVYNKYFVKHNKYSL